VTKRESQTNEKFRETETDREGEIKREREKEGTIEMVCVRVYLCLLFFLSLSLSACERDMSSLSFSLPFSLSFTLYNVSSRTLYVQRDTLSEGTVTLRTVVTFVTWNRVSSLESVL